MSARIAIVTDSTSDLSATQATRHGISVVPLNVIFGSEQFLDGIDLSPAQFMEKMATSTVLPTTSQPSIGTFEETFRSLIPTHDEIVCITISSRLSGTYQSAKLAAEAVKADIPVTVIDSLTVSMALGSQAIRLAGMAAADESVEEMVATLTAEANRYQTVFFVDGLEHLRRGGRIGKAAQLLGTMLQLRPLLRVEEGQIVPFERTRTRPRAIAALEQFATDTGTLDQATVLYTSEPQDAEELAARVAKVSGLSHVSAVQTGPVISAHVGPGMLGISLRGATDV